MMNTIAIPRPPTPFRVSDSARRVAQFKCFLMHSANARTAAEAGRQHLADLHEREAQRLLTASRS